jgi:hypothetical protein
MSSYVLPQVLVFQEFLSRPTALNQPANAVIIGEQFQLFRYAVESEKVKTKVTGSYDYLNDTCYAWPGRTAGNEVDQTYTRVFIDDALLKYFNDPVGSGSNINWVAPGKNRIRADSLVFQTANGYTRSAAFLRDVQVGDVVKILGNDCGSALQFWSTVIGLIADTEASSIGSVVDESTNHAATTLSKAVSKTGGTTNNVTLTVGNVNVTTYDGLADGNPSEVYTVEVIGGGGQNQAILRVTSQSGNDDVSSVIFDVAFGAPFAIGTRGLKATFTLVGSTSYTDDIFLIGQTWEISASQAWTPTVPSSSGDYIGPSDTTYVATVTLGGKFNATTKPQITVSTTTGIDISGPTNVTAPASAVQVGTQGVFISFAGIATDGLCKGDRYNIAVTASAPGPIRTLVLANNLPEGLRGWCPVSGSSGSSLSSGSVPDLDVTLYIKKNIEVPETRSLGVSNWTQSDTEICIAAGITAYDSSWASGGTLVALPVEGGKVYVQHRDRVAKNADVVGSITDVSEIPVVFAPAAEIDPDNPLVFGAYNALLNANGETVYFIAVRSHSPVTLADWLTALSYLEGRNDVYSLVPMTQDKQVLDAVVAHCESQSSPERGRWRICWLNMAAVETIGVYTTSVVNPGEPVLATIEDDPDTGGTQYTIVEAAGETFITKGVRPNDTVRALYTTDGFGNITYSEFIVDEVLNEETIRLFSGPDAPVLIPSKIEIWRTLSKTEVSANLAQNPGLFSSRRAYLIWPDTVGNAGKTFPGYYLCAALAGLRSGVQPHQGLTNVEILGFDDLSRTTEYFTETQLNVMASSGYWIVTQDPNTGAVFTRHQLSCGDQSDVNQREQSITTNLDNISYGMLEALAPYIGKGNVTTTMISIVEGILIGKLQEYKNNTVVPRLGPQISAATITELAQHPTYKDRIVARVLCTLPAPFNNMELYLVVQ